ncbi:MAG: Acetyltransferase protein [Candidatus Eremiobacteraeota bacterium]|nr:Acetyltransferase protein [Candidatus Eremiobacteraeota bacterium]
MRAAEARIGLASDALVTEGIVEYRRVQGVVVIDAPTRRDFWFGHGFVLDAPPTRAALDALIDKGRARFAGTGAKKFVVVWERELGTREPFGVWPGSAEQTRSVVQVYDGPTPLPDPRVVDVHGDAFWRAVAALAVAEYPQFAAFTARRFEDVRDAVRAGRARSVAILDERGEPACTVTLYRGDKLARFATPVTRPDARGRGLFSACARTLIAWALADAPRTVVILADPEGGPVDLYERLGFRAIAFDEAALVTL